MATAKKVATKKKRATSGGGKKATGQSGNTPKASKKAPAKKRS